MTEADFRSDTFTKPDAAMRRAMAEAEVGDDVWGEDPTVRRLEEETAAVLGMEAAVFTPSGTMANQIAIHTHCRPGDELLCEERAHVYKYEGGAIARLSGTSVRLLQAEDGFPDLETLELGLRADDPHFPRSRLLVLENTHNMAGGRVLPPQGMARRTAWAHARGLAVHVDGARLFHAAVACGVGVRELLVGVDSVSVCLSKGLGAPVGSVLAGTRAFVAEARRARKAFGGGMRQAGVLAAAGLLALRDGAARLTIDHERAAALADGLDALPGLGIVRPVETNIVLCDLEPPHAPDAFLAELARDGVRAAAVGPQRVRFVTHRDLGDDAVERCLAAAARACRDAASGAAPV
jgi:threonine aldolase